MVSATVSTAPCERERVTSNAWLSGTKIVALQGGANDLDQVVGQMRKIAEGLVLDGAIFAVTAAQQMGAVDLAFVLARRSNDMSSTGTFWHSRKNSPITPIRSRH